MKKIGEKKKHGNHDNNIETQTDIIIYHQSYNRGEYVMS